MAEDDSTSASGAPSPPGASRAGIDHADPGCFAELFQSGFRLAVPGPCPVRVFLRDTLGLDDHYITNRLQTVFLNGLAVDDLDAAMLHPGSRLALSAALPGLVGATMRRGGVFASLRQNVTYTPDVSGPPGMAGLPVSENAPFMVEMRLYNLIGVDLAARMLALGVYVPAGVFLDFLRSRPQAFWSGVRSLSLGSLALDRYSLGQDLGIGPEAPVLLTLAGHAAAAWARRGQG